MSVLKKMIGRARAQSLDNSAVVRAWSHLQTEVLSEFESAVPQLRWRSAEVGILPILFSEISTARPDSGLFFGFGYDEKTTSVLVNIDESISQLMSQSAFGGDAAARSFSYDPELPISRFDVLLFTDLMQSFYRNLHQTLIPKDAKLPHPTLIRLGEGVTPLPFELQEDEASWVKITLKFTAETRPTELDGDTEKNKESEEKATVAWPDLLTLSLLMPQTLYNKSLSNRFEIATPKEDLSFQEGVQNWKTRVGGSRTSLRAVVENTKMTVADCTRLEIGQIIPLPGVSLQRISIEAELTHSKVQVATGALGIHKTRRALKIVEGVDPSFIFGADVLDAKSRE